MDKEKKPTDQQLERYASSQWSDNMSFSRDAIQKSKQKTADLAKKTGNLPVQVPKTSQTKTQNLLPSSATKSAQQNELDSYVSEMNEEFEKVSDIIGGSVHHISDRFSQSLGNILEQISDGIANIAGNIADGGKQLAAALLKTVTREVTIGLKTVVAVLNRIVLRSTGGTPFQNPSDHFKNADLTPAPTPPTPASEPPPYVRQWRVTFPELAQNGINFRTIHGMFLIDDAQLKRYTLGGVQDGATELMEKALQEIKDCAPYANKLPKPIKGAFAGQPMGEALKQSTLDDLERFLVFVSNRSKPFQDKSLKLAEAYATWIHKGAPER